MLYNRNISIRWEVPRSNVNHFIELMTMPRSIAIVMVMLKMTIGKLNQIHNTIITTLPIASSISYQILSTMYVIRWNMQADFETPKKRSC